MKISKCDADYAEEQYYLGGVCLKQGYLQLVPPTALIEIGKK